MEAFIAVFVVFCFIITVLYAFLIITLASGWLSLDGNDSEDNGEHLRLSILVPARNEEENIEACLRSIVSQKYDMKKVEIIVIDDSSSDSTVKIVQQQQGIFPGISIKLLTLAGTGRGGKKDALTYGVKMAEGELIITTDADTTRHERWLASISSFYNKHKPKMIIGPVAYTEESNWFGKMQSVEFAGLVATAGGAVGNGMPMMCNGANLAFEKEAFQAVGGYSAYRNTESGDDVMLMSAINRQFPGSIKFLKRKDALVYTLPCRSIGQFMQQRIRWVSKNRTAYSSTSLVVGIIVLLMNFVVPTAFALSVVFREVLLFSVILFALKCIIDFLFLFLAASFFEKRRFLFLFIPQQLFNVLYVSAAGILAIFSGYEWKGRKHR